MNMYTSIEDFIDDINFDINFAKTKTPIKNSLVFLENEKYIQDILKNKNIIAVLSQKDILEKYSTELCKLSLISSTKPKDDFFLVREKLLRKYEKKEKSIISENALIHQSSIISEYNVFIGENVVIGANSVILQNTILKDNVIIGPNCTIGYEGFEFIKLNGINKSILHDGKVILEDSVEIQANSVVDKGIYGENTILRKNCKIDNHVHIGHNITIGENSLITANVVIGGNSTIGNNVFIGLGSSISNRVFIGDNAKINIGSTIVSDVKKGDVIGGNFSISYKEYLREQISLRRILQQFKKEQKEKR